VAVSQEALDQIALSRAEYDLIVERLDREPTEVELGLFGALWSEHCGYKHSRPLLKGFPTSGEAVRVAAGEENAGVVEIGDGLSVVFKVESHNHPSAVEPYEGAATGVGGIVRDILAMGARPMALLNSLRFGTLDDPRSRFLFEGVVAGISGYGNCIGVPDVGGEVVFDKSYTGNPLVNAMCVGLLREGEMMTAAARTPGNTLMLVGASTGRDGIHGASGLASRTFEEEREMRPTVQVGDPFMEKVLIEACLEAARSGHLEGMQDLGAAGLTSSVMESVAKGGMGLDMNVAKVPRRETGMTPYEVMLSESQERMLLIVKRGHENHIRQMFEKWDLNAVDVGTVVEGGVARVYDGDTLTAQASVGTLTEAPQYRLKGERPAYLDSLHNQPLPSAPSVEQAGATLLKLLAAPNIASKRSVYRQYDHEVQTNTVVKPGQADAAVMRLRGSNKGIAVSLDGDGRKTYLEPYIGGALAVAEACRNVACTGAKPVAITDCLNFGNPEKLDVYYQLEECIKGMTAACIALGVPVISGNVSLYNESHGDSIYPTPVVGALGVLEDVQRHVTAGFQHDGDVVLLLGAGTVDASPATLAGSEYLSHIHDVVAGRPDIDLPAEGRLQVVLVSLIGKGLLNSAHDCSGGGLGVALAESSILGNVGFQSDVAVTERWDTAFFGEGPSRAVVSLSQQRVADVERIAGELGVPHVRLGVVGGSRFMLPGLVDLPLADLADAHGNGLERAAGA
jgi:phosphoribosylformylglycinamidine synthase II